MVLKLLPWLLRGHSRPEYAELKSQFENEEMEWDLGATSRILLALVVARFAFNAALRGPTRRLAAARMRELRDGEMEGRRLLEELWVTLGNLLILGAAMFVMLRRNGGCWFLDTSTCLTGWPSLPADPAVKLYYNLELAWYLHMLLKPVLRYGLKDGRDMLIHHVATLALIVVSYGTNLTRMGVVVLGIFAISNPLLHIAKICNQLSLGPLKIGGFVAFAATFFVSRVLLVPWAVLKPAALHTRREIPHAVEDFNGIYLVVNVLLVALYLMQLLWMKGIVRVLRSAATHGSDAASQMSAKIDPAKRYAVTAEPAQAQQPLQASSPAGPDGGLSACNGVSPPAPVSVVQRRNGKSSGAREGLPQTPSPVDPPTLTPGKHH